MSNNKHNRQKRWSHIATAIIGSLSAIATDAIIKHVKTDDVQTISSQTEQILGKITQQSNKLAESIRNITDIITTSTIKINEIFKTQGKTHAEYNIQLQIHNILLSLLHQTNIISDILLAARNQLTTPDVITQAEISTIQLKTTNLLSTQLQLYKCTLYNDGSHLYLLIKVPILNNLIKSQIIFPQYYPTFINGTKYIPTQKPTPFLLTTRNTIAIPSKLEIVTCTSSSTFCYTRSPFYSLQHSHKCYVNEFITNKDNCTLQQDKDNDNFFKSSHNKILFAVKEKTEVILLCHNKDKTHHKHPIQIIAGKGSISFDEPCTIQTAELTISSYNVNKEELWLFTSVTNISYKQPKIKTTIHNIPLQTIELPEQLNINNLQFSTRTKPLFPYIILISIILLTLLLTILCSIKILIYRQNTNSTPHNIISLQSPQPPTSSQYQQSL